MAKNNTIKFRVDDEELARIKGNAGQRDVSDYLREVALGGFIPSSNSEVSVAKHSPEVEAFISYIDWEWLIDLLGTKTGKRNNPGEWYIYFKEKMSGGVTRETSTNPYAGWFYEGEGFSESEGDMVIKIGNGRISKFITKDMPEWKIFHKENTIE